VDPRHRRSGLDLFLDSTRQGRFGSVSDVFPTADLSCGVQLHWIDTSAENHDLAPNILSIRRAVDPFDGLSVDHRRFEIRSVRNRPD
jgi:hypothetical protein